MPENHTYFNSQIEGARKLTKGYTLLVIDDDPDQRMLIELLLTRIGHRVTVAESVSSGLQLLYRKYFDLVITDLRMPEGNGFDLINQLRELPLSQCSSRLPIIMLTSCSGDLEFAALDAGADMFCEKEQMRALLPKQVEFLLE